MGILGYTLLRNADHLKQFPGPLPGLLLGHVLVEYAGFCNLPAHLFHRVEGIHGTLKDDGHILPAVLHDLLFGHGRIVHPFQQNLTALHLSFLRQQLADGEGCGGLAAARLTHKTQALAVIQCEGYTVHCLRLTLGGGKICF